MLVGMKYYSIQYCRKIIYQGGWKAKHGGSGL